MLKHNEANPLAIFGLRRMEHCPPHFTPVEFDIRVQEKEITDWIWEHLSGRFWFGDQYNSTENSSVHFHKKVAFELPSEASYFSLLLDTINKQKSDIW